MRHCVPFQIVGAVPHLAECATKPDLGEGAQAWLSGKGISMTGILKIAFLATAVCALAFAQPPAGGMKKGMRMPRYDASTEITVTGTVQDVLHPQMGRMEGTHLLLKTETETLEVHLGPSSFVSGKGFSFAKGDSVQVLGSKVTVGGNPAVLAREVTKDGKTLTLRDKTGRPLWAGRKT